MNRLIIISACFLVLAFSSVRVPSQPKQLPTYVPFPVFVKALHYPVQTHKISTDDGYILTFFRIQAKNQASFKKGLPVVYLQHGLMDSADTFVIDNEPNCPGLQLANEGYDVWLGNVRGNKYSLEHTHLKPKDAAFWQFTFQNMSEYDIPAAFEYIYRQTDQKITYIGHSQGTTIMFAALSEREPRVMKYLKKYIALAPVAWVEHITSGPINLIANTNLAELLIKMGQHQFASANWFESEIGHIFCKSFPNICGDLLGTLTGFDKEYDNYEQYNEILLHEPSGTSVLNMLHWKQLVKQARFGKFDYGTAGNIQHYGQPTPPNYDVGNINIPVHLFMGNFDDFVSPRDSKKLLESLTGCPDIDYKFYPADHVTWVWSKDISFYWADFLAAIAK